MMKEGGRSAAERERTKMRERQRRSITTNIFHGLRKHGGYRLSPRADINEVLRHLAHEAGWTVHPDGTTYRSAAGASSCPLCGGRRSAAATPSCSFTTASPRVGDSADDTLLAIYMSSTAAPPPAPPPGHHHLYLLRDSDTPVSSNHNTPPRSP